MGTPSMEGALTSVGGSDFTGWGFRFMSYLETFRDGDFLWLYRARKKPISASVMCTPVAPLYGGIGGDVTPAESVDIQDGARHCSPDSLLLSWCWEQCHPICPSAGDMWSPPSSTNRPRAQQHQCVSEDVDGCNSPSGCIQHEWDEGDVSRADSMVTDDEADRLHVISSVVCSGAHPASACCSCSSSLCGGEVEGCQWESLLFWALPPLLCLLLVFVRDYLIPVKHDLTWGRTGSHCAMYNRKGQLLS